MAAPVFTDGVTALNAAVFNALGAEVDAKLLAPAGGVQNGKWIKGVGGAAVWSSLAAYGTTLPASPLDGDEAVLVDSITNPTYQWRFRYNAGSSSAYKWEFVGGSDAYAEVTTAENTGTASTWLDLATVGPRIVVPRAGDYDGMGGADFTHSAANGFGHIGITAGATAPTGVFGRALTTNIAGYPVMLATSARVIGISAGNDVRLRYNSPSGATAGWAYRWIRVRPVRVA